MSQSDRSSGGPPAPEITFGDLIRVGWRKLREMRTVFQLLVLIAIGALICAVVPQNDAPDVYAERYGTFLANIIVRLGLDHVHTATWFLLLLGLLLLSLVACSGRLWREGLARWRSPDPEAAAQRAGSRTAVHGLSAQGASDTVARLDAAIRRHGYRTQRLGEVGAKQVLYARRHRFSAWGQALAHYSVFLIALGSVMGSVPGLSLDRNVDIEEGHSYSGDPAGELPFAVQVDKFYINQDPSNGSVQNYFSQVRLLAQDRQVGGGTISVNHPLRYRGYFISQSSWGLGSAQVELTVGGKTEKLSFPLARLACPEMTGATSVWGVPEEDAAAFTADGHNAAVVSGFYADARREDGKVVGSPSEYPGHPAVQLMLIGGLPGKGKPMGPAVGAPQHSMKELGWLMVDETRAIEGGQIKFVGITRTTGLGIRKDIGLPLVWGGFIASVVGLALIFYFPLQRWVLAVEPKGAGRAVVALAPYGRASELSEDQQALWADLLAAVDARPINAGETRKEAASE